MPYKVGKRAVALSFVTVFLFMAISPIFAEAQITIPYEDRIYSGPYVDKLVYKEIIGDDQQVLALINDEIDIISDQVDPQYIPQLDAAADIELKSIKRNGFGHYTFNCDVYPLNITALRRAFAFALDKERISAEVWEGESSPHDSPMPGPNPYCIEGLMPYTYYTAQPIIGNEILDAAGFLDIDADGDREAPDGSDFQIVVEMATAAESQIAFECGTIAAEAFDSLSIDAVAQPTDFNEYLSRVNYHGDFDIVFYGYSFTGFEPYFLETMYGSDYYHVDTFNTVNWRNATYDSYIHDLFYGVDEDTIRNAAYAMQEILIYECPRVVAYNNFNFAAYRTDDFEGWIDSPIFNYPNKFTNLKIHKKISQGGPWGGTFRLGLGNEVESYNFMVATSAYAAYVARNLWMSILQRDDLGNVRSDLAESWFVETNAENSEVPVGHMRFTFDMIQNATWSDGVPITAADVAFTLNYYKDGIAYGNPSNARLDELTVAYASGAYQVVVEMDTTSFWHTQVVGYNTILPQHVFSAIGVEGWNTWNPVYGTDPHITSGPFITTEAVAGEFHELTSRRLTDYNWAFGVEPATTTTTTTTTTSTTTTTTEQPPDFTLAIVAGAVGAAVVILVGGFVLLRQK